MRSREVVVLMCSSALDYALSYWKSEMTCVSPFRVHAGSVHYVLTMGAGFLEGERPQMPGLRGDSSAVRSKFGTLSFL